jgi:hypothetical protein
VRAVPEVEPRSAKVREWAADDEDQISKSAAAMNRLMKTQGMEWSRDDMTDSDWAALRAETERDWEAKERRDSLPRSAGDGAI